MPLRVAEMNSYVTKVVSVISCAVITALFIVVMFFAVPQISRICEAEGGIDYKVTDADGEIVSKTAEVGKDVTAVRINDFEDLGKVTKVNYVPDVFIKPGNISEDMQIVDIDKPFEFAERGTLVFIFLNLDPYSENFSKYVEDLNKYKVGDYWQFTLSLPKIFCASNIYVGADLAARNGEIEGYDFIEFTTSYAKLTDKLKVKTSRTELTLNFYTRRQAMERTLSSAKVVIVHYQSSDTAYSAIRECPLLGTEEKVGSVISQSQNLLLIFAILAATVFAVLGVLSLLKHTAGHLPEIVWTLGIFLMLLSRFIVGLTTTAPLFWTAVTLCCSFIVLGGALLSGCRYVGKVPLKYILPSLMCAGAVLAFIRPFLPFAAESAVQIVCTVVKAVGVTSLFAFIAFAAFKKDDSLSIMKMLCTVVIAVALSASLFLPNVFPAWLNSMFWLCAVTTFLTFVSVLMLFRETEKANEYLTENLHTEVERQLKDIKSVITERDNLLQFVSHDMKKPLVSSSALIDVLIERETDAEQSKALPIVKQYTDRIVSNLTEIGSYAKFNYLAEPSEVVDLRAVCAEICKFHYPDCNANGIILKNQVDGRYKVYVKKQGLQNAVSNIILNAVEHADCKTITLSVKSEKNRVILCVSDDGRGIDCSADIFQPYVTGSKSETTGLGLFICRNILESMNGELNYESKSGETVFLISLLKA